MVQSGERTSVNEETARSSGHDLLEMHDLFAGGDRC